MPNESKPGSKPRKTRKAQSTTAKSKAVTQAAAQTSQPSDVQPQNIGHYQALPPPTENIHAQSSTQTDAKGSAEQQALSPANQSRQPNTDALNTVLKAVKQQGDSKPLLIQVRSTQKRGFWRCGLFFSYEGTTLGVHPKAAKELHPFTDEDGVELNAVTYEEYKRLIKEPRLEVEEL